MAESAELSRLKALFDGALAGLDGVESKRLFGCDGYFVGGNIFALVWKEGRLGLRLDEAAAWAGLAAVEGTAPWALGERVMPHWLLLPAAWHRQPARLREWSRVAWTLAAARPERTSVTRRPGAPRQVRPAQFRRLPKPGPKL